MKIKKGDTVWGATLGWRGEEVVTGSVVVASATGKQIVLAESGAAFAWGHRFDPSWAGKRLCLTKADAIRYLAEEERKKLEEAQRRTAVVDAALAAAEREPTP